MPERGVILARANGRCLPPLVSTAARVYRRSASRLRTGKLNTLASFSVGDGPSGCVLGAGMWSCFARFDVTLRAVAT